MYCKNLPPRQSGVAVVMALFIVALVSALAYALAIRLHQDLRESQWMDQHERVVQIANGSLLGVMEKLRLSRPEDGKKDAVLEYFPMIIPDSEEQGFHISSTVYDMGGLFNINAILDERVKKQFLCLFELLFPDWQNEKRVQLVKAISEWVADLKMEMEFDSRYAKQPVPYRPRHGLMVSVSELRLVYGVDGEIYRTLRPFVTAVNAEQKAINVTSAPLEVLACLNAKSTKASGEALLKLRDARNFTSLDAFLAMDLPRNLGLSSTEVSVVSDSFLVVTSVSKEGKKQVFYTLLSRFLEKNKMAVKVIWQSKGVSS